MSETVQQGTSPMPSWHARSSDEVLASLKTDPRTGLTTEEARRRLSQFGPNELAAPPPRLLADAPGPVPELPCPPPYRGSDHLPRPGRTGGGHRHPCHRLPQRHPGRHPGATGGESPGGPQKDGRPGCPRSPGWPPGDHPRARTGPRRHRLPGGWQLRPCRPAADRDGQPADRRSIAHRRVSGGGEAGRMPCCQKRRAWATESTPPLWAPSSPTGAERAW